MDERSQFIQEQKDNEELAFEALDEALAFIHKRIGIRWGDFASEFFSDGLVEKRLLQYIEQERINKKENY
jgi:hypothetical protein